MVLTTLKRRLKNYQIKEITEADYAALHALHLSNENYNAFFDDQPISLESCIAGTKALPPNTTADQKFYIGFYRDGQLVAVVDYIERYPNDKTVWLGLLMVAEYLQRRGIGYSIIEQLLDAVKANGFSSVQLGVIVENHGALAFWQAVGFSEIDRRRNLDDIAVVVMENKL